MGVFDDKININDTGRCYILRDRINGLFLSKPSQWYNTYTDNPIKAKIYTDNLVLMKKSITHGIENNCVNEINKWEIIKVEQIILGKPMPLEFDKELVEKHKKLREMRLNINIGMLRGKNSL